MSVPTDCGDSSCVMVAPHNRRGMRTNGGCRCLVGDLPDVRVKARALAAEVVRLRAAALGTDDRGFVLRLLHERRASLVSRTFSASERIAKSETVMVDLRNSDFKRAHAARLHNTEHAHLVSLEAELARCDEVIAAVEAMP